MKIEFIVNRNNKNEKFTKNIKDMNNLFEYTNSLNKQTDVNDVSWEILN